MKAATRELIARMFLFVDWNGRQSLKASLSPKEHMKLREALGGEPNW